MLCMCNYVLLCVAQTSSTVWHVTLTLGSSLSCLAVSQLSDSTSPQGLEVSKVWKPRHQRIPLDSGPLR